MRRRLLAAVTWVVATLLIPFNADAASNWLESVGNVYQIRLQNDSVSSGNGSSGSSHDVWTLTERVIALRDGGAELEFDLPAGTSTDARTQGWQFPARVFRSAQGSLVLLNAPDAERRLHAWLSEEERRLCGHWVFTWTSQYIECDPQSVLGILESYMMPTEVHAGAMYRDGAGREAVQLAVQGSSGATFVARMELDPDFVRRQRAQADVAVAEMTGHPPVSLDAALQAHASERVSGTIVTTFETDVTGRVTRRTRVTQLDTSKQDGTAEHRTTTETTDWTLSSPTSPRH